MRIDPERKISSIHHEQQQPTIYNRIQSKVSMIGNQALIQNRSQHSISVGFEPLDTTISSIEQSRQISNPPFFYGEHQVHAFHLGDGILHFLHDLQTHMMLKKLESQPTINFVSFDYENKTAKVIGKEGGSTLSQTSFQIMHEGKPTEFNIDGIIELSDEDFNLLLQTFNEHLINQSILESSKPTAVDKKEGSKAKHKEGTQTTHTGQQVSKSNSTSLPSAPIKTHTAKLLTDPTISHSSKKIFEKSRKRKEEARRKDEVAIEDEEKRKEVKKEDIKHTTINKENTKIAETPKKRRTE